MYDACDRNWLVDLKECFKYMLPKTTDGINKYMRQARLDKY